MLALACRCVPMRADACRLIALFAIKLAISADFTCNPYDICYRLFVGCPLFNANNGLTMFWGLRKGNIMNVRIVGQSPKWRNADGKFMRVATEGDLLDGTDYITIESGGGFDDEREIHEFRQKGTRVHIVRTGDAHCYSVTEVAIPE